MDTIELQHLLEQYYSNKTTVYQVPISEQHMKRPSDRTNSELWQ